MFPIGNNLREARRSQGLDITQCESATKIRARYLMALEEERFEALPKGPYVRGMVRTYAEYLGLDPAPMLDELSERLGEPAPDRAPTAAETGARGTTGHRAVRALPPAPGPRRGRRDRRLWWMLLGGAGVAVVLVWLGAASRGGPQPVEPLRTLPAVTATTGTTAGTGTGAATGGTTPSTGTTATGATTTGTAPAPAARVLVLTGVAPQGSWVQVTQGTPTGTVLYEGTLGAGVKRRFPLAGGLWIRAGWGPGLRATVGTRTVAMPDGTGDVRITAKGVRAPATGGTTG